MGTRTLAASISVVFLLAAMSPQLTSAQINWTDYFKTTAPTIYTTTDESRCQMPDGADGVCVPTDECKNGLVVIDGRNRLIPRIADSCPDNTVCCQMPSAGSRTGINNPSTVIIPQNPPGNNPGQTQTSEPNDASCGIRHESGISNRIAGDTLANFGEFNWAVAVFKVTGANEEYRCGASLIHPRAALTAALPVSRGKTWRIRAGEYNMLATDEIQPHQSSDVSEILRHKDFHSGNFANNIALLFLATAINPAPNVGFACLPMPSMLPPPGTTCIVTGWGHDQLINGTLSNILKLLEVPIVAKTDCQTRLRAVANPKFVLAPASVCAGGEGVDACKGDAGSPLVCPYKGDGNRYYQAGIVSFGVGCGERNVPGVYTDVAGLRMWVDAAMEERGYNDSTYTP